LEFEDCKKWLLYLYEINCVFSQEDYASIHKTAMLLFSLSNEVSIERERIE